MGETQTNEVCELCGKGPVIIRRVSETHGTGEDRVIVDNIPLHVCRSCHGSYFDAHTLREVDRLRGRSHAEAPRIAVPVETLSV